MSLLSGVTPMNLAALDSLKSIVKLPTSMDLIVHILIHYPGEHDDFCLQGAEV